MDLCCVIEEKLSPRAEVNDELRLTFDGQPRHASQRMSRDSLPPPSRPRGKLRA